MCELGLNGGDIQIQKMNTRDLKEKIKYPENPTLPCVYSYLPLRKSTTFIHTKYWIEKNE